MRAHKGKALIALTAAVVLTVSACSSSKAKTGGSTGGNTTKPTGTLIYGEGSDFPENFFPYIAAGNVTSVANITGRVLDGIFRLAPDVTYQQDPDQATSANSTMVNGQQVVDVKINPKAVWADGTPITSADYIFTFNDTKSTDPKQGGCASLLGATGYDQVESITAVGPTEFKMTFLKGKPFADWQGFFSGGSGSSPLLNAKLMDKGSPTANCAAITAGWPLKGGIPLANTNGPWLVLPQNINVGSKTVTLVPNPKYWGAQPKLARIVYANIGSDSDTNVKAVQNNEVNMIYPQPQLDLVANLKKLSNVTTSINFGPSFEHLDFNTRDPLLAHKEVRQAIAYAIDRPALVAATVAKFSDKASVLGNRLLVSNQTGYEDHSADYATQNVAKAKQLLTGLGATMGADGYYTLGGKKLSFKVMTTQNNPLRNTTIQLMAQQVKAAGIQLIEQPSANIFAGKEKPDSLEAGGFQIALFAWVAGPALSSNNSIYKSLAAQGGAQGQNYTHGADPAVDQALTELAAAASHTDEIADANKADKLLWDDLFTLPLYQKPTLLAYDSNYKGIADNSTQAGPLWNNDQFSVG
ncbi:MAG: glutathione transport system substrate-binding protein [Pseudonocardiales bacterium]|nr:glutathione transport system substrate-binding protein [Pseudonocardiales bacterium]